MTCYDLHCHSTASDGTLAPTAVVGRAAEQRVDVLALTDHDDTAGLAEAAAAAAAVGIRLVPGVEVSVSWAGAVVHILGLGIDPADGKLNAGLRVLRDGRERRAVAIADGLARAGIEGALDGARQLATGAILSRTHFAHFLVKRGLAKDLRDVFKRYLVRGRPGYVAGEWASLADAIDWIRGAGGQAVVAHPARYDMTGTRLNRLLQEFKERGGVGMEVVCGNHSREDTLNMAKRARQFGLLGSAGSDFHGPESAWVELGRLQPMPAGVTPVWNNW